MTERQTTPQTSSLDLDPLDPVKKYAEDVLAGLIVAGPWVRKACQRHLEDLAEGPNRGLEWRLGEAQRAIDFFPEVLRLAEGEHAGLPFRLGAWQQFIIGSIFGWYGADGFRRFRNAYIEIGKGNGKTPMAGGVGLYMMVADGEVGAHCFAAATMREQANLMFQDAVKMVDASPMLSARITKSGKRAVFNLAHLPTGSFFRPVSSEHKGLDGKRVHYAAIDELHEHPTPIVDQKMRAGTKGRRQALILRITNSGHDRESICWQQHDYSIKILEKSQVNDGWFAYVCALDKGDDYRDEKVWLKVNPNLDVSVTRKYLRERLLEAEGMPSTENEVQRFNFCIWTEHAESWMPEKWDECCEPVDLATLIGQECFGGLDLSLSHDLSGLVLLFPPQGSRTKWVLLPFFWIPADNLAMKSKLDHVSYEVWVKEGLITATPGPVVDHDYIENAIRNLRTKYQIKEIAYDRHLAVQLVQHLMAEGLTMVEFAQGAPSMNSGIRTIEKIIQGLQVTHGGHKVLRWNAANAVLTQDSNANVKFDKLKATGRIDGMVAWAMAQARANLMAGPSVYEGRGLLSI